MEEDNKIFELFPITWKFKKISEIISKDGIFVDGDWIESKDQDPDGEIRLIQLADIKNGKFILKSNRRVNCDTAHRLNCTIPHQNDILVARMPDPIGRACIFPFLNQPAITAVDISIIRPQNREIDSYYIMHIINSPFVRDKIKELEKGTTRKRISRKNLSNVQIPIPSFEEQKSIVAKIDELLARVEAARERLDQVPAIMQQFRQSVLAAACSGRLTEEWRGGSFFEEHNCLKCPPGWKLVKIKEVCHSRLGKMLDKAKNHGDYVPYLRNTNVRWFNFDLSDIKTIRATDSEIQELTLINGDVLICEGGEPGRCAIWRETDKNYIFQKAIHRLRVDETVIPEWIGYILKDASDSGRLSELFTGSTIKHLTGVSLKEFSFLLPPIPEQQEIIHRVERLFTHSDQIEKQVTIARERVETITQSILHQAFTGRLVPTKDESN